jgi:hypothetical protein
VPQQTSQAPSPPQSTPPPEPLRRDGSPCPGAHGDPQYIAEVIDEASFADGIVENAGAMSERYENALHVVAARAALPRVTVRRVAIG